MKEADEKLFRALAISVAQKLAADLDPAGIDLLIILSDRTTGEICQAGTIPPSLSAGILRTAADWLEKASAAMLKEAADEAEAAAIAIAASENGEPS